jgi:hypothetical protein
MEIGIALFGELKKLRQPMIVTIAHTAVARLTTKGENHKAINPKKLQNKKSDVSILSLC